MATRRSGSPENAESVDARRSRLAAVHQRVDGHPQGRAPHPPLDHHRGAGHRGRAFGALGGVYLLPFPMCHIAGTTCWSTTQRSRRCCPCRCSGPRRSPPRSTPTASRRARWRRRCCTACWPISTRPARRCQRCATIAYGSAAIPADLLRRALARLDVGFHQGYGMTETGGNITFLGPAEHRPGRAATPRHSPARAALTPRWRFASPQRIRSARSWSAEHRSRRALARRP